MAETQQERYARFKEILDAACANGGKVQITFAPNGIEQVRVLMHRFIEHGIVTVPTQQEMGLRMTMESGDADGCVVIASFAPDFRKKRSDFEKKVLNGVADLALVE